ncbi:ABC transporter substrate-binding protein, partial [Enterobacter hormaechei]
FCLPKAAWPPTCQVMPYPNPADIARMKQDKNINLMEQAGLNVGYLSYNTEKKPFDDVKVRQALTYAVNKEAIRRIVAMSFCEPRSCRGL